MFVHVSSYSIAEFDALETIAYFAELLLTFKCCQPKNLPLKVTLPHHNQQAKNLKKRKKFHIVQQPFHDKCGHAPQTKKVILLELQDGHPSYHNLQDPECAIPTFRKAVVQRQMFFKKGVLRNYAKFTRKQLCQSLFFNKVAGLVFQDGKVILELYMVPFLSFPVLIQNSKILQPIFFSSLGSQLP